MTEDSAKREKGGKMGKSLEEIVVNAKTGKGKVQEIVEQEKNTMIEELEASKIQRMLEEEKQKIQQLRQGNQAIPQTQVHHFGELLFAGRSPAEIGQILDSMDEERMQKFIMIASSMNNNNFGALTSLLNKPDRSLKDTIELVNMIVKMNQPQSGGSSSKDVIEAFKVGLEVKTQQSTQPQSDQYQKLMERMLDEQKAMREQMATQEKARIEKDIAELKARPSGIDELLFNEEKLARARKVFGGTDSAITNEYVLKKLDMEQQVNMKKDEMAFEREKWLYKQENEGKGIERITTAIKEVTSGPLGKLIESVGGAAAERIGGEKNPNSPNIKKAKCPTCGGIFMANPQLSSIMCPLCGAQLERAPAVPAQNPQAQTPQDTQTAQEVGKEESVDSQPGTA